MTELSTNLRHEWKFLPQGLTEADVLGLVRRHPGLFREAYPPRMVNNIYLDSPCLHDYFDHVNGNAHRNKTRIRWYGPFEGCVENPRLERKFKHGLVSGKVAHALPELVINGAPTRRVLEAVLDHDGLPEMLRSALRQVEPSLVNRYLRRYFESADRRFRLTVDSSLQFSEARRPPRWRAPSLAQDQPIIIELKFNPRHAEDAAFVTNTLPFRLMRCSKYVLGIETLAWVFTRVEPGRTWYGWCAGRLRRPGTGS
jgi:hypothetical protein